MVYHRPLIHAADPLLVNINEQAKQLGEGIFFIRHEGVIKIKRLEPRPGHRLRISSENPASEPDDVSLHDDALDLMLIGRVICICRRL